MQRKNPGGNRIDVSTRLDSVNTSNRGGVILQGYKIAATTRQLPSVYWVPSHA